MIQDYDKEVYKAFDSEQLETFTDGGIEKLAVPKPIK